MPYVVGYIISHYTFMEFSKHVYTFFLTPSEVFTTTTSSGSRFAYLCAACLPRG